MWSKTINGKALWDRPAHLEAGETQVQAAERELEETGIRATPPRRSCACTSGSRRSHAVPAFCFVIELEQPLPTEPHDSDIDRRLWLSRRFCRRPTCVPHWWRRIRSYQQPERYPLSLVGSFARFKGAGSTR